MLHLKLLDITLYLFETNFITNLATNPNNRKKVANATTSEPYLLDYRITDILLYKARS